MASNLIGAISGDGSKLFRSMYKTYRATFPTVVVHPFAQGGDEEQLENIIVVASEGAAPATAVLLTAGGRLDAWCRVPSTSSRRSAAATTEKWPRATFRS